MIPVLLFEDQKDLCVIVQDTFALHGLQVTYVHNGNNAAELIETIRPATVIVDIMMPETDGLTTIQNVRRINGSVPIVTLTAKQHTEDLLKAFELGCNDYVRKPFVMEELVARVQSFASSYLMRTSENNAVVQIGNFSFNATTQQLKKDDSVYHLSYKEAEILNRLINDKNQIVTRKQLLEDLWGTDNVFNSKTMNVYMNKLRNYFAEDTSVSILTVRGVGYKLALKM